MPSETESAPTPSEKAPLLQDMLLCSCAGENAQHPSAHDQYNCGQKLTGTVRIPFVELQLADGEFVVFEEIG